MRCELEMKKSHPHNNYTLCFSPVSNNGGTVRFIDPQKAKEDTISFTINDEEFGYRVQQTFSPVIADLIDLAVAIHASDRLVCQNLCKGQSFIYVVLPVRHPEVLRTKLFQEKLENLLGWTTGSQWIFDFQQRIDLERSVVEQQSLQVAPQNCEVALWSGGLDSLAGFYTQAQAYPDKSFVLFGTGSNDNVYDRQGKVAKQIQSILPNRSSLYRLPIRFHDSNAHSKNKIARARGVVFALLGSACAYLMGRRELSVYENGVGAINLPYRASAVGLDHSRSVHPLTLLMVSEAVSELIGETFKVHNPFLFSTKAEMCQLLAENDRTDLIALTSSCDSPHRQRPSQCGYCSSCLLRRQALAASKIKDETRYVILHGKRPAADPSVYLRHMLYQVGTLRGLLDTSDCPDVQWQALTQRFFTLDDIVDRSSQTENLAVSVMQNRLVQLYRNYVNEWDNVEPEIAIGLLHKTDQQLSDKDWLVA
jgi:7-cyano-7-deazaguanine synthase in queuosine biosynthesis